MAIKQWFDDRRKFMKRIKVIANNPGKLDIDYDISAYIGNEYDVIQELNDDRIYIDLKFDKIVLYPGEYEVVE